MTLPKGVIFDVDGTLLDSMSIWEHAGAAYLHTLGITAEPNLDQIVFPMTMEQSCSYIKEHYHLSQSVDEVLAGIHEMIRAFYFEEAPLKSGAAELLELLDQHRIPMVIASTSEREHIEAAFLRLGIDHYFAQIFTATEVGAGKHQPDIYLAALDTLSGLQATLDAPPVLHEPISNAPFRQPQNSLQRGKTKTSSLVPSDVWVFEDVGYAIKTAKQCGFYTVGVADAVSNQFQESIEPICDMYIRDFFEIL